MSRNSNQTVLIDFLGDLFEGHSWGKLSESQRGELLQKLKDTELKGSYRQKYDALSDTSLAYFNEVRTRRFRSTLKEVLSQHPNFNGVQTFRTINTP